MPPVDSSSKKGEPSWVDRVEDDVVGAAREELGVVEDAPDAPDDRPPIGLQVGVVLVLAKDLDDALAHARVVRMRVDELHRSIELLRRGTQPREARGRHQPAQVRTRRRVVNAGQLVLGDLLLFGRVLLLVSELLVDEKLALDERLEHRRGALEARARVHHDHLWVQPCVAAQRDLDHELGRGRRVLILVDDQEDLREGRVVDEHGEDVLEALEGELAR